MSESLKKANHAVDAILENIDNISVNEKLSQQVNLVFSNQNVPDYYDESTYYYDFMYRADEKNTKRITLTPYQRNNEKIWGDGYIFQKHQAIVQSLSCFKKWLLENYYESGEEIDTSKGKVRVVGTTDVSSYTRIDGDIACDYRAFAVLRT